MLTFQNVTKVLNGREVMKDISFRIAPGEFVCFFGPRDSGKTLLLHLLLGAIRPTSGTVAVDGVDLSTLSPSLLQLYRRSVGIAFGGPSLLPDWNVAQNVAFPLQTFAALPPAGVSERVGHMLERLHLLQRSSSLPCDLHEGECQKALLARALVTNPKLLLIDNISSDLDGADLEEILDLLMESNAEGMTIVLATRNHTSWEELCTRLIFLEDGKLRTDERLRDRAEKVVKYSQKERGVHITPTPIA